MLPHTEPKLKKWVITSKPRCCCSADASVGHRHHLDEDNFAANALLEPTHCNHVPTHTHELLEMVKNTNYFLFLGLGTDLSELIS